MMQVLSISFLFVSFLFLVVSSLWVLLMSLESRGLLSSRRYCYISSVLNVVISVLCVFIVVIALVVLGLLIFSFIG